MAARSVLFDVVGRDQASKAFLSASKSADVLANSTDRAIKRVEASGARLQAVGQRMSKALTLPLIAAAGVAVDQAVKYQKAMTLLQTAGGESAAKMAVISKGLMDVAKQTGTSLHDLGDGMYTIAKAGSQKWSAIDQLKVLKAAAQGAKAENVDLGTATNALTSIMLGYKMSASDAVKAENELIRGSALSKTTFQDFANSLSNVVPLAASLHVSFAQIAGAEATMTQHGESAQQSTQNLHNILAALAGQNNVASAAMQQLGINTVDLAKNLGTRGLSGSLAIVDKAIKDHTKNGMVMLDSHKLAALATKSLNTEIAAMPTDLARAAKSLLDGSIHRKDFLKDIKGMNLQSQVMGRSFLVTANQAMGFNSQLKAGKGNAETAAKAYQTMLGGVTGMNVALMVGGEYMGQTKGNIDQIAIAAKKAGVDVLGWSETQGTLAVKLDKAKANLQVLAVEVGTALIPAVSKLVGWITSAVTWFDGLSGSTKKFIGITALVVGALGPVIAIAGRVTKAVAFMWGIGVAVTRFIQGVTLANVATDTMATKAWAAGFKIRAAMSEGISATKGLGSALGGAAIGVGIGMFTQHMGTAQRAIGAFASTALGAAQGFAIGGPLGAAIGGGVGLLSNLATAFLGAGDGAKKAVKPTDDFTNAIREDNGVLGKNTELLAANKLEKSGLYDAGLKLGISQRTLTLASMGNKDALAQVAAATLKVNAQLGYGTQAGQKMTAVQRAQVAAAQQLTAGLGALATILGVNTTAANNIDAGLGKVGHTASSTTGFLGNLGLALDKLGGNHPINIDTSSAAGRVASLQSQINGLFYSMLHPPSAPRPPAAPKGSGLGTIVGHAAGGSVSDGVFTVGEQGYEIGVKRGNSLQIISHPQAVAMTGMSRVPGYAGGTKGLSGTSLSNVVQGIGGLLAAAHNFLSTAADLRTAAKAMFDAAKAGKDSSANLRLLAAQSTTLGRLGAARDSVIARLGTAPTAPTAYDRLATAQGNLSSARDSISSAVGAFDVTTAGVIPQLYNDQKAPGVTAGSIIGQLWTTVQNARKYAALLKKLGRAGLPHDMLLQLANAGPAAMAQAQALAVATPKEMLSIRNMDRALTAAGGSAGSNVANLLYKPGVQAAQGLVNGLLSQESTLNRAIKRLGDGMVAELKHTLKIKSPSQVMHGLGVFTAEGFRLGVASKHDDVAREGNRMAHKIHSGASGGGGGGNVHYHTWNIQPSEGMDEQQLAAITSRRLAALVY